MIQYADLLLKTLTEEVLSPEVRKARYEKHVVHW